MLKNQIESCETLRDSVFITIASKYIFVLHSVMQSAANILDYSSNSKAWQENIYISSWDVRSI